MPALEQPARVGALDNPKWEDFAKHIVAGETQVKAYELAFGNDHPSVGVSASQLIRQEPVARRIAELRKIGLGSSPVLTLARKRTILRDIVETAPGTIDENSPLCQSYKRRIDKDGGETIEYELPNKLKALELDAKLAGELNGSPQSLRISMFAPGQAIEVEAEFVTDSQE